MAGCGNCPDTCNCNVTAGAGVIVTGNGSGANPYVITADGEVWIGTSPLGSISIGNLGPNAGHTPTLDVEIAPLGGLLIGGAGVQILVDPASTAPVSLGAAGLRVDCCPATPPAISDTDTVDLASVLGILTANVIPNTAAGLENQAGGVSIKLQGDPAALGAPSCGNRLRFNNVGDLTHQQDGLAVRALADGAQVFISALAAGNFGGTSFTAVITNGDTCPVYVNLEGVGEIAATTLGASGNDRILAQNMILDISAVAGGGVDIGGDGLHAISEVSDGVLGAGEVMTWRGMLSKWALIPAGGSVTFRARSSTLRLLAGYTSTPGTGSYFQFYNPVLSIYPQRVGGWLV